MVVLNGDTFFDVNLNEFMERHRLFPSSITVAFKSMRNFNRYGKVDIDSISKKIVAFHEKQQCDAGLINGGVYLINKLEPIFDGLHSKFSFEKQVLEPQCSLGKLYGVVQNGYFIDIGIPEDYANAQIELPDKV